jgi:hypothetical protein
MGQPPGQGKIELHSESEIVFFTKEVPALFLFIRDERGRVARLLIIQDGRVTEARRKS